MISVIIPAYNEEGNVAVLFEKIKKALAGRDYEVIFIDDGSTDRTFERLDNIKDKHLKIIKFRKNFGQTAAWSAGFSQAKGDILVTLDADLQNDPNDIPRLLEKIDEGYDAVSGWRVNRHDKFSKKVFSKVANRLRGFLVKDPIHDAGCSLKAYRKECFKELELYGEMHRYVIALLNWKGFKIGEVPVKHYFRHSGKTKYGLGRVWKGMLDLINVWFWKKYSNRPLHVFGGLGILLMIVSGLFGVLLLYWRLKGEISLINSSLPTLAVLGMIIGVQFFVSGLLADIAIKNYYGHNGRKTYSIERVVEK